MNHELEKLSAPHHTILWIDDDPDLLAPNIRVLCAELTESSRHHKRADTFSVVKAKKLDEGLCILQEGQKIDAIICDLSLGGGQREPNLDDLLRELQVQGRPIPVIIYSGYDAPRTFGPNALLRGYAKKPEWEELLHQVQNVFREVK